MHGDRLYLWPSERRKESGREAKTERREERDTRGQRATTTPKLFAEMHYLETKQVSLKVETKTFCAPFLTNLLHMYITALAIILTCCLYA